MVNLDSVVVALSLAYYRKATGDLTHDLMVLSRDFAVIITSGFHGKRRPQNQLQIRRTCISDQAIKGHYKKHINNNS